MDVRSGIPIEMDLSKEKKINTGDEHQFLFGIAVRGVRALFLIFSPSSEEPTTILSVSKAVFCSFSIAA